MTRFIAKVLDEHSPPAESDKREKERKKERKKGKRQNKRGRKKERKKMKAHSSASVLCVKT